MSPWNFLIILLLVWLVWLYFWFKSSSIPWLGIKDTIEINKRIWNGLNKALIYPTRSGIAKFAAQPDAQNIQLYDNFKRNYGSMAKVFIIWRPVVFIMSTKIMRDILYNSPQRYGPGKFKINYFKPFMAQNVGINYYPEWTVNRPFNEKVLGFRQPDHPIYQFINQKTPLIVRKLIRIGSNNIVTGEDFLLLGRYVSYLITFGQRYAVPKYYPYVWDLIASSVNWTSILGFDPVSPIIRNKYLDFMHQQLDKPEPDSLMNYAVKFRTGGMNDGDVIDQVPHWVFPLSNIIFNIFTAYLALLEAFPNVRHRVQTEVDAGVDQGNSGTWLHWSILETIRMYGIVLTLTRTSMYDQTVTDENGNEYSLQRGDQLFMLTSVLSNDPTCFSEPKRWNPERWSNINQDGFCDVIFNIGPQICPGSNLVKYLLKAIVNELLQKCTFKVLNPKLDPDNLPAALNSWTIQIRIETK
uniref:Cytochrome P450 n=1 Tax=Marseillevirus LCMAC201 TaxID=2506605 RepID=A0A481YWR7_9VIRU|nr:MAG: cytochrome P450 [Marseillevirus LCMAC201]